MSLQRSTLKALGLNEDQINSVVEGHSETVSALNAKIAQLEKEAEEKDQKIKAASGLQAQLDKANETISKLEKSVENAENAKATAETKLTEETQKSKKLEEELNGMKETAKKEAETAKKKEAFASFVGKLGLSEKGRALLLKHTSLDAVKFTDDGQVADDDGSLKKSLLDDWGDYITTKEEKGANVDNPKKEKGTMTREQIMKIKDPSQRQEAIAKNIELFR